MHTTLPAVRTILGTALVALLVPMATAAPAEALVINGCDIHLDDSSPACLAFDTDGGGWLHPDVEITWPTGPFQVGSAMTVTAHGEDLLRPVTLPITRSTGSDDYTTVGSLTVGPGAMTASTSVTLEVPGENDFSVQVDDYDDAGLYVYDHFQAVVTALPSSLTSDLPSGRVVKVGAKSQPVTGTVTGGARPVDLQVRAKDGAWVTVASTTSTGSGSYVLAVPTFWVGRHTYRAVAPAFGSYGPVEGTKTSDVTVKRTYKPKGSTAHRLMFGPTARWNACAPIRYAVNTSKMPAWAPKEIRYALREASAATGLRFAAAGTTNHVPFARKETPYPDNVDLVFAFSTPRTVPDLAGSTIGLGGAAYTGSVVFDGGVTLDVAQKTTKAKWREVVLHEVGHAMGLGHVRDRKQVMVSGATGKNLAYAKGDLTGLGKLSADAGACTGEPSFFTRGTNHRLAPDAPVEPVRHVVLP